jgi:hypothetical protein
MTVQMWVPTYQLAQCYNPEDNMNTVNSQLSGMYGNGVCKVLEFSG